jgi:hypothetical protein
MRIMTEKNRSGGETSFSAREQAVIGSGANASHRKVKRGLGTRSSVARSKLSASTDVLRPMKAAIV